MGHTRVLCVSSVENRVPPHAEEKGIGWISAEYGMLPRAGVRRTPRGRASGGGRAQEISRLIARSFRAVVDLALLGPRSIVVDCDVIQADGGTRTAAINGGFVALVDALRGLYKKGDLADWPVKDYLTAVSVGWVDGKVAVDMAYEQDVAAEVDFNVVMTGAGNYVEVQGTAEGKTFGPALLSRLLAAARKANRKILSIQKRTLKSIKPLPRRTLLTAASSI